MDYVLMCMYRFTHDAVYLYLLTVNQTLAEGYSDYRDGHLILNKTIGQRFVGRYSTRNDSFVVLNAMAGCTMAEKFRPIVTYNGGLDPLVANDFNFI